MKERITVEKLPPVENEEQKRHLIRYVNFINSRPERVLKQRGFATHHIYPRSLAKKNNIKDYDDDWNLIELTHQEHFIAHMILFYCGYHEMKFAFISMSFSSKNKNKFITSKIYGRIIEECSDLQQKRIWVKNDKLKISKHIQSCDLEKYTCDGYVFGRIYIKPKNKSNKKYRCMRNLTTDELIWVYKDFDNYLNKGYEFSGSNFNRISIKKGTDNKYISKNEIDNYINNGWVLGSSKNGTKNKCWINNGKNNKCVDFDDIDELIELGWKKGMLKKNSYKGCVIINNGKNQKKIFETNLKEFLNHGWRLGKLNAKKTTRWINNGYESKKIDTDEILMYINNDWVLGRLPKPNKTKKLKEKKENSYTNRTNKTYEELFGIDKTNEIKEKISKSLKGRKRTEEQKKHYKESWKNRTHVKAKSVKRIETGIIYKSTSEAEKLTGEYRRGIVSSCEKGEEFHGFHWVFVT